MDGAACWVFLSLSLHLPCTKLALTLPIAVLVDMEFKLGHRPHHHRQVKGQQLWRPEEPVGPGTNIGNALDRKHVLRGRQWVEVGDGVYSQRQELRSLREKPRSDPRKRSRRQVQGEDPYEF